MESKDQDRAIFQSLAASIGHLARGPVSIRSDVEVASQGTALLNLAVDGITVGVAVEGEVDLVKALDRIKKQKEDSAKEMNRLSAKLGNDAFVDKAPADVVQEHRNRIELLTRDHDILQHSERQLRDILRLRTA
jgi:valyl-tRNA synthetase